MLRPKLLLLLTETLQNPRASDTRRLLYLRGTGGHVVQATVQHIIWTDWNRTFFLHLNCVLMLNWIVWNGTVYMYKNGFGIK